MIDHRRIIRFPHDWLYFLFHVGRSTLLSRQALMLENIALRSQLAGATGRRQVGVGLSAIALAKADLGPCEGDRAGRLLRRPTAQAHTPRAGSLPRACRRVEAILMGNEPSGLAGRSLGEVWLSLTTLTKQVPVLWDEQRRELGMV